jgi:hypothetical protein
MTQSVLNSGQFRRSGAVDAAAAVSYLDARPAAAANPDARRTALWPVVVIAFGGLLTVVWDGFLLWQFVRLVVLWLGSDA